MLSSYPEFRNMQISN